jgi:transposase-like protein
MSKKYDREFKLEAIRMATEEGHPATEVERRLGISQGMISRWKRQLRTDGEEAFRKLIYLALGNITKKWTKPIKNWKAALNQFAILFEERVVLP